MKLHFLIIYVWLWNAYLLQRLYISRRTSSTWRVYLTWANNRVCVILLINWYEHTDIHILSRERTSGVSFMNERPPPVQITNNNSLENTNRIRHCWGKVSEKRSLRVSASIRSEGKAGNSRWICKHWEQRAGLWHPGHTIQQACALQLCEPQGEAHYCECVTVLGALISTRRCPQDQNTVLCERDH